MRPTVGLLRKAGCLLPQPSSVSSAARAAEPRAGPGHPAPGVPLRQLGPFFKNALKAAKTGGVRGNAPPRLRFPHSGRQTGAGPSRRLWPRTPGEPHAPGRPSEVSRQTRCAPPRCLSWLCFFSSDKKRCVRTASLTREMHTEFTPLSDQRCVYSWSPALEAASL